MEYGKAAQALDGIPYTPAQKGLVLYDLVRENNAKDVLELGFAHGCSTCYFAAALQENGGHIDAVDLVSASFSPTAEELVSRLGFESQITLHREHSSYTWFLKKKIEAQSASGSCEPCYDIVFIDGPKDWTNDGAAFFMADKLLREGGLMVFDDYGWSYRDHERASGKRHERGYIFAEMSESEFAEPQIKAVFHLLVTQNPNYSDFRVVDNILATARKTRSTDRVLRLETRRSPMYRLKVAVKKALGR